MSKNNNETQLVIKPAYQRHISIDENIHQALSLYALSLYMAFRYEADFRAEDAEVKRSAKFLYTKAKISRPQYYRCLNELEAHGLVLRDPENKLGDKCVFHVARELNYFTRGVSEIDRGVSQRDTDHNSSSSSINTTISDNEILNAYHEELPECPRMKKIDSKLHAQFKRMIKDWPSYQKDGKEFTIDSFRDYLRYIKQHYPWFIKPYTTESGNIRRNNLRVLTREINITKIVNGEFSAS